MSTPKPTPQEAREVADRCERMAEDRLSPQTKGYTSPLLLVADVTDDARALRLAAQALREKADRDEAVAAGRNRQRYLGALSMRDAVLRLLSTAPVLATTEAKAGALRDVIAGLVRSLPLPPIVEEDEAVAQAQADLGLVFGPWFEGERHAVAVDGCRYTLTSNPEDYEDPTTVLWIYDGEGSMEQEFATGTEAIEAARPHDEARRAKGTT